MHPNDLGHTIIADHLVDVIPGWNSQTQSSSGRDGIAAREILIGIHNSASLTGSQSNLLLEDRESNSRS
jgi:hypothetical protein